MKSTVKTYLHFLVIALAVLGCKQPKSPSHAEPKTSYRVDSLLEAMTVEEKVGQLNFLVGDLFNTGPTVRTTASERFDDGIRNGEITGLFNVHGAAYTGRLQRIAVEESRLGIPLLFGADVIHGFKTVFPIPLGTAASWDLQLIEACERAAAVEATAAGITFNFAPMVDIARDARWGRIAESAGEDPYLGSRIAEARVRGFQGDSLQAANTLAACIKHFAAYGAPLGGRDYNTVELSERTLHEVYLEPYRAGIDAGARTVMTSFNDVNGEPASGSSYLLRTILRDQWGFDGMVVSDWQSISEMIAHGVCADTAEAAALALQAGVDMDMMAKAYLRHLPRLIEEGKVDGALLDDAVRRVLQLKEELGLFEDPYRYSNESREQSDIRSQAHLELARDAARKSAVLLRNEGGVLPLATEGVRYAVLGPLADSRMDINGTWSFFGEEQHAITYLRGFREAVADSGLVGFAHGCSVYSDDASQINEAVSLARKSDVAVLVLGEAAVMNGEAASRSKIDLPGGQQALFDAVEATGKPIVCVIVTGRPLDLSAIADRADAILVVWTPGSEGGRGVSDVLFGKYNPSGKLPATFPRNVGQVPAFYAQKHTGRAYTGVHEEEKPEDRVYRSRYRDVANSPLYPFGFGLSYTTFSISDLKLSDNSLSAEESLTASVVVTNTGKVAGEEVVQLYIQDVVGSTTRPVRELKGFEKVALEPGESKTVQFTVAPEDLAFYTRNNRWEWEPGDFNVFVGNSSDAQLQARFNLIAQ